MRVLDALVNFYVLKWSKLLALFHALLLFFQVLTYVPGLTSWIFLSICYQCAVRSH